MPTGDAYSSGHLVPSLWDLHIFYLLRPIHYRTCRYFTGLCSSNIPRYFSRFCFSHFRLLLWNRWTEFNETWQETRTQHSLPSLCFSGRSEKHKLGRPGLWLAETFSTSPPKPLNGIQRNLTGNKISRFSTQFVFFEPIGKNKMAALASDWLIHFRLFLWNRWTELNETWQEDRSQRPLPSSCFLGLIGKTR